MASGTESEVEEVETTVEHVVESSVVASTTAKGTPASRESVYIYIHVYIQKVREQGIRFWNERTFWHEIINPYFWQTYTLKLAKSSLRD